MRFILFVLAFSVAHSAFAQSPQQAAPAQPEEVVISYDDLGRFAQAMLRVYALSNEVTLRVAAKKENLEELHAEMNRRALTVLDDWGFTLSRYNDIERSYQLIPSIKEALAEHLRNADPRLQKLATTPKTLDDARMLLRGKVDYPITAKTLPWLASEEEKRELTKDVKGQGGANPMSKILGSDGLPKMP